MFSLWMLNALNSGGWADLSYSPTDNIHLRLHYDKRYLIRIFEARHGIHESVCCRHCPVRAYHTYRLIIHYKKPLTQVYALAMTEGKWGAFRDLAVDFVPELINSSPSLLESYSPNGKNLCQNLSTPSHTSFSIVNAWVTCSVSNQDEPELALWSRECLQHAVSTSPLFTT